MRKVLVICMVVAVILGIVPCASATIASLTYDVTPLGGEAYSISIFAPGFNVTALNVPSLSVVPEIGSIVVGSIAVGTVSSSFDLSANNGYLDPTGIAGIAGSSSGSVTDALYTFTWTGTSSTGSIGVGFAGTGGPLGTQPYFECAGGGPVPDREDITGILPVTIPEPATMCLLGLGGLLLRRRK